MFRYILNEKNVHKKYTKAQMQRMCEIYLHYFFKKPYLYLRTGDADRIETAEELLNFFLDKQNTDTGSPDFGLWKPDSDEKYDKNTSTHLGIPLFALYAEFGHLLSQETFDRIESALSMLCICILNRNIHMQSTHILLGEAFLTAACGEYLHNPEFTSYAVNLMRSFYHYTLSDGEVTEYNSQYNMLNLCTITLSKRYIKNEAFLQYMKVIEDIIWTEITGHYHYSTDSISAPSERRLESDHKKLLTFYKNTCKSVKNKAPGLSFYDICPRKYRPYFEGTKYNEFTRKIVSHGAAYPYFTYSQTASVLMRNGYTMGSFNRGECWQEKISFSGAFGTRTSPFHVKVTVIHDGEEFSSGQLSMIQDYNYVLGHTTFATNRGDRHIEYDITDGSISATDLRVRFSIKGNIPELKTKYSDDSAVKISYKNLYIYFGYSHAKFDNRKIGTLLTVKDGYMYFDMILYKGRRKKIDFTAMKEAIVSWIFCISEKGFPESLPENFYRDNKLITGYTTDQGTELKLVSLYKPDTYANIHTSNGQYIQDTLIEKYIIKNANMMRQYSYIIDYIPESPFEIKLDNNESVKTLTDSLSTMEENDIIPAVKNIFSQLYRKNVTLILIKRIAVQIISKVFEYYREKNVRFEMIIADNSQTYQLRISSARDSETVAFHLFGLLKLLHANYISFIDTEPEADITNHIITLIDEEYSNPDLSLEYIAEICGKSIYTVSRIFKKISNLKYIDYLTNIRMNHAKDLLRNTDMSLEDISRKVGYLNSSSLIRTFKKKTGKTPNKYRADPDI